MKETRQRAIELLVPLASQGELTEDKMSRLLAKAEVLVHYIEQGARQPDEAKPVPKRRRVAKGQAQV